MGGLRHEGASGNVAEVDVNGYALVNTPTTLIDAGYVLAAFEQDDGSISGTPDIRTPKITVDEGLVIAHVTPLFDEAFMATTQDTGKWNYAFTGMTMTAAGGTLLTNANSIATAANGAYLISKQQFPLTSNGALRMRTRIAITALPLTNQVFLIGLGFPASVSTTPADGAWIRITTAGVEGIVRYNGGAEVSTGIMRSAASLTLNQTYMFRMTIHDATVNFWIDDVVYGKIPCPAANPYPFMFAALPAFIQQYNAGTVSGSPQMQVKVGTVSFDQLDSNLTKPYPHIQARKGLIGYQGQAGNAMGSTATYANSANPTAAIPTNTALTANLPAGMSGGQGLATMWNLAATDMLLWSFQNPSGTVNIPPRTMMITGIRITAAAFTAAWTAAAAGNPCMMFALAFGHTAASLATAETGSFVTASAKSPRRKALGLMSWGTTAPVIGQKALDDITLTFQTPIPVNPGEYVALAGKIVNGAAVATGALLYTVDVESYLE